MVFVAVFLLSLLIALFAGKSYRNNNSSYGPVIVFFFILFMAGLASQYWIKPIGPLWYGISWIPLLFILIIFSFMIIAPSPYERPNGKKGSESEKVASSAISIFVWLLFLMLIIAIVTGMFQPAH